MIIFAKRNPFVVAVACLLLFSCRADQSTVIKLGHGLDVSHPVHRAMARMAEAVAEKSAGSMRIDIYPSEQLGTERQSLELLQIGGMGMTKVSAAVLEGFSPKYRVFGLPYLFRDDMHRHAVLEGAVGAELLESGTPFGLRGVVFYDAGSRSFYTKDAPILEPADLNGLKIRTMESPMAIRMVRQLGGSATPISWGELYTALQQGVVDGAENNPPSFYLSRHYEVCGYYSLDEHTAVPDVLVIGERMWTKLSAEERVWLMEAAEESAQYQKQLWERESRKALEAVEEAGVQVVRPGKEKFIAAVEPLYDQLRRDEPEVYRLVQEIRDIEAEELTEPPAAAEPAKWR